MKSRLLIIISLLVLVPSAPLSYACSCASPIDYVQAVNESEYVFIGTVTNIDNSGGPQKIHFNVMSTIKGDISGNTFVLRNTNVASNSESIQVKNSSCDVGYQLGVTYNVFVYENDFMNNDMCTTKAIGFIEMFNLLEYNISYYLILGLIVIVVGIIIGIKIRRKRK
ncbi:hypothetical protein [Nitrosopumilus ureiphilus]|uniref:Tissue inhibitor of metalloproteinase n=1 Tax=Nitrosopumilus ureiphilus TaxID=1470067 RepID=A0A7D5M4Z1_9ARCH|nr:hypothetical protein [Nitrosopumilus ureiphilus]QLH06515.1 hypothetical protein C5F50_05085 [Nitrosopumilus ureiphilus]